MELRKFPRSRICAQQKIIEVSQNNLNPSFVITKDISASGFSFSSTKSYDIGTTLLVIMQPHVSEDLELNRAGILKYGSYFLARVVWNKSIEVGCEFVDHKNLDLFTRLVNLETAHSLNSLTE